jgi:hypothetical protein
MDILYLTTDGYDREAIHLYLEGVHRVRREVQPAGGDLERGTGKPVSTGDLDELRAALAALSLSPLARDEAAIDGAWCELRIRDERSESSFLWFELPAGWTGLTSVIEWLQRHAPSVPSLAGIELVDEE